jgi:drug/metabolite transporter (DMT)-like permease
MSPYAFLFLAFTFTIVNRLYGKYALNKVDSFALALSSNALGILITIPFAWPHLSSIRDIAPVHWGIILLLGILWTYISWAGNLSVAQNNYSFKEIIRQTRIIWVVIAGIVLLDEQISFTTACGILLITSSVFIISYKQFSFREHVSSKALLLAWAVSFVAAFVALLEKVIVDNTIVIIYVLSSYVLTTLFLSLFINVGRVSKLKQFAKNNRREAIICAVLMFCSYFCALKSYELFPISIAYPIIQSSTVVGILVGTYLFEENKQWGRKFVAALVAVAGVILVKLF